MTTTERLLNVSKEIWEAYHEHPFVKGIADGSLDKEKFKYYMIQDYLYLIDYTKVFALGAAKAKDLSAMKLFAGYTHAILDGEMDIHRAYMARLGITPEEAEMANVALDNLSYTSYMLRVAYEEGQAEVAAAILSCAVSYEVIAKKIVEKHPEALNHPFYGEWVSGYVADAYHEENQVLIDLMDRLSDGYSEKQLQHLEEIFMACSRYAGEFVCVIGPSGCGKSTIFRLVNKLLTPAEGMVLVNGTPIEKQKNYCGYMPQQDLLFPWRTVKENLMLPMEIQGGISKVEMEQRADQALESVGLKDWGKKSPKELSGGMRQRAAFARTVLTGSDLLLLDEPFSALDYLTRLSMREWLLEQWEREKKTVLFITHDVEEAVFLSSRILVVENMPITHLKSIEVPAEYPRTREELMRPEIVKLKEDLIDMLRRETV